MFFLQNSGCLHAGEYCRSRYLTQRTHLTNCASRKYFEITFWLETSKNDCSSGGSKVATAWVSVPFTSQKMRFYSQCCPFVSQKWSFVLWNCPFFLPKMPFCFPEVPFYFSKMPYCFPKLSFSMPKVTSILDNLEASIWSMIFYV